MKNLMLGLAAATMTVAPVAASAHTVYDRHGQKIRHNHGRYQDYDRYQYRAQQYRYNPYRAQQETYRYWKGRDGRVYCQRRDGTVGLIVGAGAGALIGREVDRGVGTIVGGALGALLGRETARGNARCR